MESHAAQGVNFGAHVKKDISVIGGGPDRVSVYLQCLNLGGSRDCPKKEIFLHRLLRTRSRDVRQRNTCDGVHNGTGAYNSPQVFRVHQKRFAYKVFADKEPGMTRKDG